MIDRLMATITHDQIETTHEKMFPNQTDLVSCEFCGYTFTARSLALHQQKCIRVQNDRENSEVRLIAAQTEGPSRAVILTTLPPPTTGAILKIS